MNKILKTNRAQRSRRIRMRLAHSGLPRLSVFRSQKHIWVQVIDDQHGRTIVSASSKKTTGQGTKTDIARHVGRAVAISALAQKIKQVVFDRGPYKYHGRVRALAEGAREGGLEF